MVRNKDKNTENNDVKHLPSKYHVSFQMFVNRSIILKYYPAP